MNRIKQVNWVFLITIAASLSGSVLITFLFAFLASAFGFDSLALMQVLIALIIALPTLGYLAINRINIFQGLRINKIKISTALLCVVFAFVSFPLMSVVSQLSQIFVENQVEYTLTALAQDTNIVVMLFAIAVMPAIFEEIVYRGMFYLEYRKTGLLKGIILSGLLFGLMHQNVNQFSYAFLLGMVFCLLMEATDTIVAPMIVHFTINATSVVSLYLIDDTQYLEEAGEYAGMLEGSETLFNVMTLGIQLSIAAVSAVLCCLLLYVLAKNCGRKDYFVDLFRNRKQKKQQPELDPYGQPVKKQSLITAPLIIGIVVCVIMMIVSELAMYLMNSGVF